MQDPDHAVFNENATSVRPGFQHPIRTRVVPLVSRAPQIGGGVAREAVLRLTHYLALAMCLLLVSEDLLAISTSGRIRHSVILVVVVCLVLGKPLSWNKVSGADLLPCVRFEVNMKDRSGVTAKMAAWLDVWLVPSSTTARSQHLFTRSVRVTLLVR